jgi:hypothetical protein
MELQNLDGKTDGARRAKTAAANVTDPRRDSRVIDAPTRLRDFPIHRPHFSLGTSTMRPTSACLAPGFMKRSLDEFKRLSNFGELPIALSLHMGA